MLKYYIPLSFREMSKKFLLTNTIASWYILYRMEFFYCTSTLLEKMGFILKVYLYFDLNFEFMPQINLVIKRA